MGFNNNWLSDNYWAYSFMTEPELCSNLRRPYVYTSEFNK